MTGTATPKRPPVGDWRQPDALALSPILTNARDAFYEFGYHGTTVRDIARRTGITVPALYYHHENKEAILFAILDTSIRLVTARCEAALADASPAPRARFQHLVECITLHMAQHSKEAAMDAEIRALGATNRRRYSAKRRVIEQMLNVTIDDGVANGDFHVSSPTDTARALLGMMQAITVWFRPGGPISAQSLAGRYVDIALHTVGAKPDRDPAHVTTRADQHVGSR
jgi:AcrR family transcriptional regulator